MEIVPIGIYNEAKVRGIHSGGENGSNNQVEYFNGDFTEPKNFTFNSELGVVSVKVDPTKCLISADYPLRGAECFSEGGVFELKHQKGNDRFTHRMRGKSHRIEFHSHGFDPHYDMVDISCEGGVERAYDPRHHEYLFFERSEQTIIRIGKKIIRLSI